MPWGLFFRLPPPPPSYRHVALTSLLITSCPSTAKTHDPTPWALWAEVPAPCSPTDAGFQVQSLRHVSSASFLSSKPPLRGIYSVLSGTLFNSIFSSKPIFLFLSISPRLLDVSKRREGRGLEMEIEQKMGLTRKRWRMRRREDERDKHWEP